MKPARLSKQNAKAKLSTSRASPESQLKQFIAKFEPKHQTLIREVRKALRKRLPTTYEMVYDNYNFLVIGYSPTERPSDAILSIAAGANGVGLCFIHGAKLPDPNKILLGSGKQTRFIRLDTASVLRKPEVNSLITAAIKQVNTPMRTSGREELIIRSISAKQRPRRRLEKGERGVGRNGEREMGRVGGRRDVRR